MAQSVEVEQLIKHEAKPSALSSDVSCSEHMWNLLTPDCFMKTASFVNVPHPTAHAHLMAPTYLPH